MLVGAFALSLREGRGPGSDNNQISAGVRSGMHAFSVLFGLLVGVFGGLGYTATEFYLDTCAEWMPLALDGQGVAAAEAEEDKRGGKLLDDGDATPVEAAAAKTATLKEAEAANALSPSRPPPLSSPPPSSPPPRLSATSSSPPATRTSSRATSTPSSRSALSRSLCREPSGSSTAAR